MATLVQEIRKKLNLNLKIIIQKIKLSSIRQQMEPGKKYKNKCHFATAHKTPLLS